MSRRQHERASRFEVDIEQAVRVAAVRFRDNDVESSTAMVLRLWWTSRLRGRRFTQLVAHAGVDRYSYTVRLLHPLHLAA